MVKKCTKRKKNNKNLYAPIIESRVLLLIALSLRTLKPSDHRTRDFFLSLIVINFIVTNLLHLNLKYCRNVYVRPGSIFGLCILGLDKTRGE